MDDPLYNRIVYNWCSDMDIPQQILFGYVYQFKISGEINAKSINLWDNPNSFQHSHELHICCGSGQQLTYVEP